MNAIQFSLLIKDKELTTIYAGAERGCRCGCHGRYFKPGEKGFMRALNAAKDLDPIVSVYQFGEAGLNDALVRQADGEHDGTVRACASETPNESWVDICRGNGKTITIYYKG